MDNKIYIAPSVLSADLTKLVEQVKIVEENGADFIHVDVMDGHFVPNITYGPAFVKTLKSITNLPLDVHLMIENPDNYIKNFAEAGASIITVHVEACKHLNRTVNYIKSFGIKAGVSLNPATPIYSLEEIIADIDLLLVMSVNPGFGGQKFIESSVAKIEKAKKLIDESQSNALIEVDGGISPETAQLVAKAGARILVAGNAIFNAENIGEAVLSIKHSAEKSLTATA